MPDEGISFGEIVDSNIKIEASALLNSEDEFQKENSSGEGEAGVDRQFSANVLKKAFKSVTIEPIVFVHLTATLMTSICTIDLILERACSVNNKFPDEICQEIVSRRNLSTVDSEYDHETSRVTASITIWRSSLETSLPIFFFFFLGRWTDLHGTKLPMLFSIGGSLFQQSALYISSFNKTWNAQTVALLASLPVAVTGSQISFNLCLHSYIADTSPVDSIRMIRIGIANAAWLVGSSLGLALGGIMAGSGGAGGTLEISSIFGTAIGLELFCFMGVLFFVRNTKKAGENDEDESNLPKVQNYTQFREIVVENCKKLLQGIKSVFRKREDDDGRVKMILMLATLFLTLGPTQGESNVMYLFVREQVNWSASEFGIYGTYRSIVGSLGTIISLGIFTYLIRLRDPFPIVGLISGASQFSACFVYAFANSGPVMYLAPVVDMLNGTMVVIARAMISKLSGGDEQGPVQSFVGSLDILIPVIVTPAYGFIYRVTIGIFPGTIFLVSALLKSIPPIIIIGMFVKTKLKENPEFKADLMSGQWLKNLCCNCSCWKTHPKLISKGDIRNRVSNFTQRVTDNIQTRFYKEDTAL